MHAIGDKDDNIASDNDLSQSLGNKAIIIHSKHLLSFYFK